MREYGIWKKQGNFAAYETIYQGDLYMLEEMIEFAVEVAADVAEAVITDKVKKAKRGKRICL